MKSYVAWESHFWSFEFLCNCLLADDGELSQESSKDSFIDKDDICAKIESLGGMVIEKYDEEIVSIFSKVFS